MLRSLRTVALTGALLLVPAAGSAQLAVAPKVGTTGVGADVALELTNSLVLRAGFGTVPVDLSDIEMGDITADFTLPSFITAGVDFYPAGSFRLMAGVLLRQGEYDVAGRVEGSYEIGNTTYTQRGEIIGEVTNASTAPYVGIGFGKHTNSGFGFFLDLGVAFTGDPDVSLTADSGLNSIPGFAADLEIERQRIEADLRGEGDGDYVDLPVSLSTWPFIQAGFRIALGG